jgi:hypothetical protein
MSRLISSPGSCRSLPPAWTPWGHPITSALLPPLCHRDARAEPHADKRCSARRHLARALHRVATAAEHRCHVALTTAWRQALPRAVPSASASRRSWPLPALAHAFNTTHACARRNARCAHMCKRHPITHFAPVFAYKRGPLCHSSTPPPLPSPPGRSCCLPSLFRTAPRHRRPTSSTPALCA